MSISREVKELHEGYEQADDLIHIAVDDAFDAVQTIFSDYGFDIANDDRAETLIAHIYQYLIDSAGAQ